MQYFFLPPSPFKIPMSDSYKMFVIFELFLRISLLLGSGLFTLVFPYASPIFYSEPFILWTAVTMADHLHVWRWQCSLLWGKVWDLYWCSLACCLRSIVAMVTLYAHNFQIPLETPCFGVAVGCLTWFWALLCPQQGHLCKLWVLPVPPRVVIVTTCHSNLRKEGCKLNVGGLMLQVENKRFPPLSNQILCFRKLITVSTFSSFWNICESF